MTDFLPCGSALGPPARHGNRQEWADAGGFGPPARDDLETTMKKNNPAALAAAAMALAVTLGPARAADVPRISYGAAAPYRTYNWIGPYIGVNAGYQWGSASNSGASPSGLVGGAQGGYNWQIGEFVFGAETDLQYSGANDTFAAWKFSNPWFGTLRGRAGYAMNNVLLYATFGLAYGGGSIETGGMKESNLHVGWAAGAGMEVGLTPNWSAKAEYLFVDLSDERYVLFGNTGFESSILRLGVNYRF
jgi:outer membrane immunogenic protein